jgi:hypothetical protein
MASRGALLVVVLIALHTLHYNVWAFRAPIPIPTRVRVVTTHRGLEMVAEKEKLSVKEIAAVTAETLAIPQAESELKLLLDSMPTSEKYSLLLQSYSTNILQGTHGTDTIILCYCLLTSFSYSIYVCVCVCVWF